MMDSTNFFSESEVADINNFLEDGYIIRDVESPEDLRAIRDLLEESICGLLGIQAGDFPSIFDQIHQIVSHEELNDLRLNLISKVNSTNWIRSALVRLARKSLYSIVGSELAMQLRLNLSIQMPEDDSSLLPIHSDTWSGDSPFEVVLWLPFVDCFATKSMFILPSYKCKNPERFLTNSTAKDSESLYREIEADLEWLNVRHGQFLLFNQNLPHGNRINKEQETRWSVNCRFKGVFTPYADKQLGEFFEPITLRPASRIGINYHESQSLREDGPKND